MNPPSTCLSTVPNRDHFALFAAIFNGKYLVLEKQGVLMKLYICEGIQTGQRAPQQGSTRASTLNASWNAHQNQALRVTFKAAFFARSMTFAALAGKCISNGACCTHDHRG